MRVVACLVLVACAGTPSPKRPPPSTGRIARAGTPTHRPELAPPPPIDLAVVIPAYDETRPWPLSELPSVQPHWDPAMAHDACSDDWRARHASDADAKAYVAAWCRLRAQDRGAIDDLGRLARSARGEIAKAARLDVVNLAADWWDAKHAMEWLDTMSLGSVETFDLLMGTYVALLMRDQARVVVARVERMDPTPKPRAACERLIATSRVHDPMLFDALHRVGDAAGTCQTVAQRAWCAIELVENNRRRGWCAAYDGDLPDVGLKIGMLSEYRNFYRDPKTTALNLVGFLQVPGAEDVAVTALENYARISGCDLKSDIPEIAQKLLAADSHSSAFDARLAKLTACRR